MSDCSHAAGATPGASCSSCLRVCVGDHCVLLSPSASAPGGGRRKRTPLHEAIAVYYEDPVMQKTEDKNGFSIYAVRVSCLTVCDGEKYLIAIVPGDASPEGARYRLGVLPWVSFQSQYLPEGQYRTVGQIRLEPKSRNWVEANAPSILQPLSVQGRNMRRTWYRADLPNATKIGWWLQRVDVEHKHRNTAFELPDTTDLSLALNMFRTTIVLSGVECQTPQHDVSVAPANVDERNRRQRLGAKRAGRLMSANIVAALPEADTRRFS